MGLAQLAGALVGASLCLYIGRAVHRLYFSPLSKFPGPKHAAISDIWFVYAWLCGRWPQMIQEVHKKYGDVVRIAPNDLSFATAQAYNDVLGHASKGRRPFLKDDFYDQNENYPNLVTARDPLVHQEQKRAFASGFSAKSLRAQEDLVIHQYSDAFMKQIGKIGVPGGPGVDMEQGLTWVTFDIIGDLAFGEPFGAVAAGKTDFWISTILNGTIVLTLSWLQRRLPILNVLFPFVLPKGSMKDFEIHETLSREKAMKRIKLGQDAKEGDLFSALLRKKGDSISEAELVSHARIFIIAGSETTSTAMTGLMVYLMTKSDVFTKLAYEVRTSFQSYEDITGANAAKLPYLNGVIQEGLRLFPPVPEGMSRVSPGAEVDGVFVPAGAVVRVAHWNTHRDERYWHDPEQFKPERWYEQNNDNKNAFNAFSRGPRVCIGINLAQLELRIIMAKMVWLYDFEWVDRVHDYFEQCKLQVLWWKPPLFVRFHLREGLPEGFKIPDERASAN